MSRIWLYEAMTKKKATPNDFNYEYSCNIQHFTWYTWLNECKLHAMLEIVSYRNLRYQNLLKSYTSCANFMNRFPCISAGGFMNVPGKSYSEVDEFTRQKLVRNDHAASDSQWWQVIVKEAGYITSWLNDSSTLDKDETFLRTFMNPTTDLTSVHDSWRLRRIIIVKHVANPALTSFL